MNNKIAEMIELRGLAQFACDLRCRLEGMDDGVRLVRQGSQAVNARVCSNIKNNLSFLGGLGPTIKDLFFHEISAEEVELPLQHFAQIARHLQSTVAQMRQARRASAAS